MPLPIPIIGAMITAGAGLLGSALGFAGTKQQVDAARAGAAAQLEATKYAADSNLQSTRETNQANKWMVEQNNALQLQLQREMNEYNSAASQFARFKEAGLNPYLSMQGQSAGIQTSTPATQAPQFQTPLMPSDYGSQVGQAYNMITQALDPRIPMTAASQFLNSVSDLGKDMTEARKNLSQADYQDIVNRYTDQIQHNQAVFGDLQNQVEQTVVRRELFNVALMGKELDSYDQRLQLQLALTASEVALNEAKHDLTINEAEKVLEDKLKTIAETAGLKLNNSLIMPLFELNKRLMKSQTYHNYAAAHAAEAQATLNKQLNNYYKALGVNVKNQNPLLSALNSGNAQTVKSALNQLQSYLPEYLRKEYSLDLEIFDRKDLPMTEKYQQYYDALIKRTKFQNAKDAYGIANDAVNTYLNIVKSSASVVGLIL